MKFDEYCFRLLLLCYADLTVREIINPNVAPGLALNKLDSLCKKMNLIGTFKKYFNGKQK